MTALVPLLVFLVGCASVFEPQTRRTRPEECDHATAYSVHETLAHNILATTCRLHISGYEGDTAHIAKLADDHPAPVDVALAAVACWRSGECRRGEHHNDGPSFSYGMSATLYGFVSEVEPESIRAEVHRLVGKSVGNAFVNAYVTVRDDLFAAAKELGPRYAAVYLEPIAKARAQVAADRVAFASFDKRAADLKLRADRALLEKQPVAALRDEAIALRRAFVDACRATGRNAVVCLGLPIARPLGQLIVRTSIAAQDRLVAEAEVELLASVVDRTNVMYAMHAAVAETMAAERERAHEYGKAQHDGVDAKLLAEKFPVPPLDLGERENGAGFEPQGRSTELESAIISLRDQEVRPLRDVVADVVRSGSTVTLRWKAVAHTYSQRTGCYETNKVERIGSNGEIEYRWDCTGPEVSKTVVDRKPDVVVPADDARAIRPGDIVQVVARGAKDRRDGRVIKVYADAGKDKQPVLRQIGAFPL